MRTRRFWTALFLMLAVTAILGACDSDSDDPPVDGDVEQEIEQEVGQCENGQMGCSGTVAILCEELKWVDLTDCADVDKVCERGLCVYPPEDGDAIDGDSPTDGDIDGDRDADVEPPPDTTPPQIASTSPSDGAAGIAPDIGIIRINFDEEIFSNDFVLRRDVLVKGGCLVISFTGQITSDNRQIELTLLNTLESGVEYTVDVLPDVLADDAGNLFAGYTFSFTVSGDIDGDCDGDLDDSVPPAIDYSFPYDGEEGVETNVGSVIIYFTEELRTAGWTAQEKVTITGDDNHSVGFSSQWLADNSQLNLMLDDDLHDDTVYTVALGAGLLNDDGLDLGDVSITFSTADPVVDGDDPDGDVTDGDVVDADADGDDDTPPPNTGQLDESYRSDCILVDGDIEGADDFGEPYLSAVWMTSEAGADVGRLRIYHNNFEVDTCLQGVSAQLVQDGRSLTLTETLNISGSCGITCHISSWHEIDYLVKTHYSVTLWYDGQALTLDVPAPSADN